MTIDIRQIALEAPLKKEALWVETWKTWVTLQELTGEERSDLLQQCSTVTKVNGKTKSEVNLKKLYPMMVVQSLRNPDADTMPDKTDPHYAQYPGAVDDNGAVLTPVSDNPGALVFSMSDLALLNKGSGATLELISKPVSIMSGLREEDIEEKKPVSGENPEDQNTVESTGFTIG